jgi:hypothetical protein
MKNLHVIHVHAIDFDTFYCVAGTSAESIPLVSPAISNQVKLELELDL